MRLALTNGGAVEVLDKLGEGGEGVVFAAADPGLAVKLFHSPRTGKAADKLRAMVRRDVGRLADFAAWPSALIEEGGAVRGLVMPRAREAFDIHAVYSPRDRWEHLPHATWKFLTTVAANLSAAVHAAHTAGVVIGDINHGSVRVGADGRVRLIDCDSFQVRDGGVLHRCDVGVDAYTPPELQGVRLSQVDRTETHDRFGLAVLIFQLLMQGRHPYSGTPKAANAPTDLPGAITAGAYAYSGSARVLDPPPSAPPIALLPPDIVALFERAFAGGGHRPSASDWHSALGAFIAGMKPCPSVKSHDVSGHLAACPWCAFSDAGVDYFPEPLSSRPAADDDVDPAALRDAWRRVEQAQQTIGACNMAFRGVMGDYGPLTVEIVHRLKRARRKARPGFQYRLWGRLRRAALVAGVGAQVVAWIFAGGEAGLWFAAAGVGVSGLMGFRDTGFMVEAGRIDSRLRAEGEMLRKQLESAYPEDGRFGYGCVPRFTSRQQRMIDRAALHHQAASGHAEKVMELQRQIRRMPHETQLKAYLAKFPITRNCAPGVGDARLAQLTSFGICTAADVEPAAVQQVPGFGSGLTSGLMAWRREFEKRFRFDPDRKTSERDIRRLAAACRPDIRRFWKGLAALRELVVELEEAALEARSKEYENFAWIDKQIDRLAQNEADARAMRLLSGG